MESEAVQIVELLSKNTEMLIFGGLTVCGVLAIVFGSIASIFNRIATERSRREIAAYIAEGSMTPEQGERLMASNPGQQKNA